MFTRITAGLIAGASILSTCLPLGVQAATTEKRMLTSYYAHYFHGRTTANGERFDMWGSTAASKWLPFGTRLKVCFFGCEVVRINDRGPFVGNRELDVSYGVAKRIGLFGPGVGWTTVTFL